MCKCTTYGLEGHRPSYGHAAAAACLLLLNCSSDGKSKVRNRWVLMILIFQFFCSPCLQWNSTFSANAPHMILQPTDQFLPSCFCLPLTIIKKQQQQHEKNGEKRLSVDDFLVLMLTIFSIKMLISVPTRHTWYHRPQTNFCTATFAAQLLW